MKYFFCLLILLFVGCIERCFIGNNNIQTSKLSFTANASEHHFKKRPTISLPTIDDDSSGEIPDNQKKKNRKVVRPMPVCISNESYFSINSIDNKSISLTPISYYFNMFFGNGKRGPPSNYNIS